MELDTRRDQFSYFLGFAAKKSGRQLAEAIQRHEDAGYSSDPTDVFTHCPFNDSQKQIMRAVQIYENSKQTNLATNLQSLVGEFLFLASNFEPPCCGDGRTFYTRSDTGPIWMECDRCDQVYDLDENPIKVQERRLMTRVDFLDLFVPNTEPDWAYHSKLRNLI